MRVGPNEFQDKLTRVLGEKRALPAALEAQLFDRAEELLAARRERLEERGRRSSRRTKKMEALFSRFVDLIAIRPDIPAFATAFAALVFAFLALHGRYDHPSSLASYTDFSDFSGKNDAPDRYDAQRLAEQKAYEREVEDAHRRNSGGI